LYLKVCKYDHAFALDDLKRIIKVQLNNKKVYRKISLTLEEQGKHDESIENYTQAIRCNPDYLGGFNDQAILYPRKFLSSKYLLKRYLNMNKFEESLEDINKT